MTSVTTSIDNPVFGDTAIETTFADYKNFGTIKFPATSSETGRRPCWI